MWSFGSPLLISGPGINGEWLEPGPDQKRDNLVTDKKGNLTLTLTCEDIEHSPELKAAMETWKEIKFEFDTVDKLDVAHK